MRHHKRQTFWTGPMMLRYDSHASCEISRGRIQEDRETYGVRRFRAWVQQFRHHLKSSSLHVRELCAKCVYRSRTLINRRKREVARGVLAHKFRLAINAREVVRRYFRDRWANKLPHFNKVPCLRTRLFPCDLIQSA